MFGKHARDGVRDPGWLRTETLGSPHIAFLGQAIKRHTPNLAKLSFSVILLLTPFARLMLGEGGRICETFAKYVLLSRTLPKQCLLSINAGLDSVYAKAVYRALAHPIASVL